MADNSNHVDQQIQQLLWEASSKPVGERNKKQNRRGGKSKAFRKDQVREQSSSTGDDTKGDKNTADSDATLADNQQQQSSKEVIEKESPSARKEKKRRLANAKKKKKSEKKKTNEDEERKKGVQEPGTQSSAGA